MVLMLSIYLAVIVMHIGPVALEFFGNGSMPMKVFGGLYMALSLYPLRGLTTYMPVIIRRAVHVSNIEMMKNHECIEWVLKNMRSQKDERVKRLLEGMQEWVVTEEVKKDASSNVDYKSLVPREKYEDISRTIIGIEPSGELDAAGLKQLMEAMGQKTMTLEEAKKKVDELDEDGSGTVSEEEYIIWMSKQAKANAEPMGPKELVDKLFGALCEKGSDSVDTEVMKKKLNEFPDLSDEDIYSLIEDLDDDGSGDISLQEASEFIEKYAV